MASKRDSPRTLVQIIDDIERIREELFSLQRELEEMEPADAEQSSEKPLV